MSTVYVRSKNEDDEKVIIGHFPGDEKVSRPRERYKTPALIAPVIPVFLVLWWLQIGSLLHILILTFLFSFIFSFLIYLFFFDEDNFFRWITGPRG